MSSNFIYKYKPYYIDQSHVDANIKELLHNFIKNNMLNIIIYGPSNSGKTTLIDAICRDYFEVPPHKPLPSKNILYINILKEQGISYYRSEMKTFCKSTSSIPNKKKIIYIDDLDTINDQYQQIFRTYIDKYNKNVQFICSCSVIQKIVISLQSRLTTIKIPGFTYDVNKNIVSNIVNAEKIHIDDKCKEYLLHTSNNCIRTIINNLEKIYLYDKEVDIDTCKKLCFHICIQHFDHYITHLKNNNISQAQNMFHFLYDLGYSVIDILEMFLKYIKISSLLTETQIYESIILISKYIVTLNKLHENKIELIFFTNDMKNTLYL